MLSALDVDARHHCPAPLPGTPPFFLFVCSLTGPCVPSLFLYSFASPSPPKRPFTFLRSLLPPLLHQPPLGRITSLANWKLFHPLLLCRQYLAVLMLISFTCADIPLSPMHPASLMGWFISRYCIFPFPVDINIAHKCR